MNYLWSLTPTRRVFGLILKHMRLM